MKLQELLKERERIDNELKKYEVEMQRRNELNEWKERFEECNKVPVAMFCFNQYIMMSIPPHVHEIIVNALQAAIDKIEKE